MPKTKKTQQKKKKTINQLMITGLEAAAGMRADVGRRQAGQG